MMRPSWGDAWQTWPSGTFGETSSQVFANKSQNWSKLKRCGLSLGRRNVLMAKSLPLDALVGVHHLVTFHRKGHQLNRKSHRHPSSGDEVILVSFSTYVSVEAGLVVRNDIWLLVFLIAWWRSVQKSFFFSERSFLNNRIAYFHRVFDEKIDVDFVTWTASIYYPVHRVTDERLEKFKRTLNPFEKTY